MATEELHVGDVGTDIIVTVKDDGSAVDLSSGFDTYTFIFCKPDGTVVSKAGSLNSDGSDGKIKYTVETGLLDVHGDWKYQIKVETTSSSEWYSDWGTLPVHKNLS